MGIRPAMGMLSPLPTMWRMYSQPSQPWLKNQELNPASDEEEGDDAEATVPTHGAHPRKHLRARQGATGTPAAAPRGLTRALSRCGMAVRPVRPRMTSKAPLRAASGLELQAPTVYPAGHGTRGGRRRAPMTDAADRGARGRSASGSSARSGAAPRASSTARTTRSRAPRGAQGHLGGRRRRARARPLRARGPGALGALPPRHRARGGVRRAGRRPAPTGSGGGSRRVALHRDGVARRRGPPGPAAARAALAAAGAGGGAAGGAGPGARRTTRASSTATSSRRTSSSSADRAPRPEAATSSRAPA